MSISAIGRLFGRSPFAPMQAHMEKVSACVEKLPALFGALKRGNQDELLQLVKEISRLEHAADLTKNNIRNELPKSMFMPIDRGSLLEILSLQDAIADTAENVAVVLTFREVRMPQDMQEAFDRFLAKNLDAFDMVHRIIKELHELLESSFGGFEAEKVNKMVEEVASLEHEVDLLQRDLMKLLFSHDDLPVAVFELWMRAFEGVAEVSNLSEKLGYRIRMTLELK